MENSTVQLGSTVARPVAAQQWFWAHLAFRPVAENRGGKAMATRRRRRPISVSRKFRTGGKGGEARTRVEETGLEELGKSGAHRRGYPWQRTLGGEERQWGAREVVGAGAGKDTEVHWRGVELEEATVG
jgi:hypothetical protein